MYSLPDAGRTLLPLIIAVACGLGAGAAAFFLPPPRRAASPRTATALAWGLAVTYAVVFTAWAWARLYALDYTGIDLGEYAQTLYRTVHGDVMTHTFRGAVCAFDHCSPILLALSPLALVFRNPAYLLALLSLSVAATILFLYLTAATAGNRWLALALAASFALLPFVHGATLYENPVRGLPGAMGVGALYFFARRRFGVGVAFAFVAASVSEEAAAYALPLILAGTIICRRWRAGAVAFAVLALYFGLVCAWQYPKWAWGRGQITHVGHYLDAYRVEGVRGLLVPQGDIGWGPRLWYFAQNLGPVAPLLPGAGPAALVIILPAYVVYTNINPSIVRLGYGFPLAFIPFVYGAAAFGVHALSRLPHRRWRRAVTAGAAALAVVAPLASGVLKYRGLYQELFAGAYPNFHRIGVFAGLKQIPADASVCADADAFPWVAAREVATYYPCGTQAEQPLKVDYVFLDRGLQPPRLFPARAAALAVMGYRPWRVTPDYALYRRGAGTLTADDVWRAWYGVIPDENFFAPGGFSRSVRDDAAPLGGTALRVHSSAVSVGDEGAFFPPGRYRLRFLAKAGPEKLCHVVVAIGGRDAATGERYPVKETCWTIWTDGLYHHREVYFKLNRPSYLSFSLDATNPFWFDGIMVDGDHYTATDAARYSPT
jgi:uncharacterized membrane protein